MKGIVLFSAVLAAISVGVPLLISWYARGWVAIYDSPKYTFDDIPNQSGTVSAR